MRRGGIYTLSKQPDSKMSGNYIHGITLPPWADYETSGIYMDEQTSGYTVKNNVLENAQGVARNQNGKNNFQNRTIYINKKRTLKIERIIKNAVVKDNFDLSDYEPRLFS